MTTLNYGNYYQHLRQSLYEDRFGREYNLWVQSDDIKFPKIISNQFELIHKFIQDNYSLKAELYYKLLTGEVENLITVIHSKDFNEPPLLKTDLIKGKGRYYGIDLSYEHRINRYQFYLIYSYNKSENSFPIIEDGNYFQKAYARTHQFKSNHTYHLDHWDFTINTVYGSSLPYNDIFITRTRPNDRNPKQQTKYLEDYFRFLKCYTFIFYGHLRTEQWFISLATKIGLDSIK